jgi:Predicted periplasmic protein (DUF2271)
MKSLLTALALTTALIAPELALAKPINLSVAMKDYGGDGAYLAIYLTDASGTYQGSLWMAGGKSKYYKHMGDWFAATGGDRAEVDGITGASVGQGRSLEISFDLADAMIDAGYELHIDAAVEDMRDSPSEIVVPLTSAGAGKAVKGGRYIASFTYGL